MAEKAPKTFEQQHDAFDKVVGKEVVGRSVALRSLGELEQIGAEQTAGGLQSDTFAKEMFSAYDTLLDLDDQEVVKPPFSEEQRDDLQKKRNIYKAFLPKAGVENKPAQPTKVDTIATNKAKS